MTSMNPVGVVLFVSVALWLAHMWRREAREFPQGGGGLPGASACPARAICVAVAGTLILLALETWGEIRLGIADAQRDVSWLALPMFAAAAFTEEVIFRGYLVIERRGNAVKWASAIAFSLIFALLHDHLWNFEMPADTSAGTLAAVCDGFSTDFSAKAIFSTAFILRDRCGFISCDFSNGIRMLRWRLRWRRISRKTLPFFSSNSRRGT